MTGMEISQTLFLVMLLIVGGVSGTGLLAIWLHKWFQERRLEEERLIREEEERRARRRRQREAKEAPKPPPAIQLEKLSMRIETPRAFGREGEVRAGTWINPKEAPRVRPVAVLKVNDWDLEGKVLPIEFQILDENHIVKYRCTKRVRLRYGQNLVYSKRSEYRISSRTRTNNWSLQMFAHHELIGRVDIKISGDPVEMINDLAVTDDMEISDEELLMLEKANLQMSLDELLS